MTSTRSIDIGDMKFSRVGRVDGEARLARILNQKARTIGVDRGALAAQVAEKHMKIAQEKLMDLEYDNRAVSIDTRCGIAEMERRAAAKEVAYENSLHWGAEQAFHTRKEYDLNRPRMLQTDRPIRMGVEDPSLSVSSIQIFSGEDNKAGERKKMQMTQSRVWFDQQAAEKKARELEEKEDTRKYVELAMAQEEAKVASQGNVEYLRRLKTVENARVNIDLSASYASAKRERVMEEMAANELEIQNNQSSPFLNEHPAGLTSNNRVRKDMFKGMHDAEKKAVLEYQAAQRDEIVARRNAEQQAEREYARYSMDVHREFGRKAAQIDALRRQNRKQIQDTLLRQRSEKAEADQLFKTKINRNVVAPEFFQQFGRSHR